MSKRNNNKKQQKKPVVQESKYIEAEVGFTQEVDDDLAAEIFSVLEKTPFNKISFPLSTYRSCIEDGIPEDDLRVTTIGYIKKYDAAAKKFTVIVFPNFMDAVKTFENPMIEAKFVSFSGKLGCITKLNMIPTEPCDVMDSEESDADEKPEDANVMPADSADN